MVKNVKKIVNILLIFLIIFGVTKVYALTEKELNEQKENVENAISQTHTEIAGIKEQMTENLEQINRLNSQISEYEEQIKVTEENIKNNKIILEDKKQELEQAEEKYKKQKEIVEKRLVAIYQSSKTTYLDILLGSKDLTDFVSKYYLVQELAGYDEKAMKGLENTKTALEIEKTKKQNQEDNLESSYNKYLLQKETMEILINDKNLVSSKLNEEEKKLEEELNQYEEDKKEIEEKLRKIALENKKKASITPSECGYISPLVGKTSQNITTGFYGYSGHTGVDFAVPAKTEIHAVKDGTVVISEAKKNANGKYRSYGEYIVIDHHDGTMTLYAHGTSNSRVVNVGDEVKQGQVIMQVGSTGNSTGPHLHFEVRINGKVVNPTAYLPK